jgi:hypothetical protein
MASTPPKLLNNTHLPSMTGMPASGPISPSPKTAVPSVTTPRYSIARKYVAFIHIFWISRQEPRLPA